MLLSYIDPAIGSMLLQGLAALLLAGGVFFRRVIFSPLSFFTGKKSAASQDQVEE